MYSQMYKNTNQQPISMGKKYLPIVLFLQFPSTYSSERNSDAGKQDAEFTSWAVNLMSAFSMLFFVAYALIWPVLRLGVIYYEKNPGWPRFSQIGMLHCVDTREPIILLQHPARTRALASLVWALRVGYVFAALTFLFLLASTPRDFYLKTEPSQAFAHRASLVEQEKSPLQLCRRRNCFSASVFTCEHTIGYLW